jgi:hypothetical protein
VLLTCPKSSLGDIGLAESTNHQENANISGGIVHRNGGARNGNVLLCASGDINIIISSSIVADIPERLGQDCQQLGIKRSGVLGTAQLVRCFIEGTIKMGTLYWRY